MIDQKYTLNQLEFVPVPNGTYQKKTFYGTYTYTPATITNGTVYYLPKYGNFWAKRVHNVPTVVHANEVLNELHRLLLESFLTPLDI